MTALVEKKNSSLSHLFMNRITLDLLHVARKDKSIEKTGQQIWVKVTYFVVKL